MKRLALPIITSLLLLAGCEERPPRGIDTKEELVDQYIQYVRTKQLDTLKQLHHPRVLGHITEDNANFFQDAFQNTVDDNFPANATVSFKPVDDPNNLMFSGAFDYPVIPTHTAEISYSHSDTSGGVTVLSLVETDEGWFLVLPVPTSETLVQYRQAKIERAKQAEQVEEIIQTMDPTTYGAIVEQLKGKSLLKAVNVYKDKYGDDTTLAVLTVREIRRRESLEP